MEFDRVNLKFILKSKGVRIVDNFEDELKVEEFEQQKSKVC